MAVRHVLIPRSPEAVWAVLCDGGKYEEWVIGTDETEEVDPSWPTPGASIRYTVRLGRWSLAGRTVVRICEPGKRLELEAKAGSLGTARIAVELLPWGEGCLVRVDEHPLTGPGARLHSAAVDVFIQIRHRRMLHRLSNVVQDSRTETRVPD
ncbi:MULTISPECIES: SRPBCC family protein [unclassified Streptomyces]|uniref:SRPBCC family protein n=1 Tax=unclassified Streptomyces TaxID=2593676 RepID=UPI000BF5BFBE|nr:SRPBCC family protein [Streptomyces sp. Ru87]PGH47443.1 polyketide cyclase [Streptomyces sp. Ru87]